MLKRCTRLHRPVFYYQAFWVLAPMVLRHVLLAGHAIMLCALAIAAAPGIGGWARRPRIWRLVVIGNTGAMTLYLWHLPALLGAHLVFDYLGLARWPGQPHFICAHHRPVGSDGGAGIRAVPGAAPA